MPSRLYFLSLIFLFALLGAALGRAFEVELAPAVVLGVCALAASIVRPRMFWLAAGLGLLALGLWRGMEYREGVTVITATVGHRVEVTGIISDDPVRPHPNRTDFRLKQVRVEGVSSPGAVEVRTHRVGVRRGDEVVLEGVMRPGFGPWQGELFYPRLVSVQARTSWLGGIRAQFIAGMRTALPEPMASLGLGLLVGVRSFLPKDLQAQLALVGLSHVVAVSGYNLTILVRAANTALGRLGRGNALVLSLWLVAGFVVLTGASAAIVRAGVVAALVLLAAHFGRSFQPLLLILLVAAGTALWNPAYLTDLGWQLSFLAFYGILVLAPLVAARLRLPDRVPVQLLNESLCAHVLTLPLIMLVFGQMSVIAPLANLLVLPLIPFAMLLSFIAGLSGMFIPALSGWFAWPADLLLRIILALVDGLAHVPGAGREEGLSLPVALSVYGAIALLTLALQLGVRRRGQRVEPRPLLELGGSGITSTRT